MMDWKSIKRSLRYSQRTVADLRSGHWFRFARPGPDPAPGWPEALAIRQAVLPSETLEQKQANIGLACRQIGQTTILPQQIFSFWAILGPPTADKGYQASRNIVRGRLATEIGGGLCQVAGLVYHMALKSGLRILERHAHSVDIYREEERFTPLGTDAAVVFGYKDFRFVNTLEHPIRLGFSLAPDQIIGRLQCPVPVPVYELELRRQSEPTQERVELWRLREREREYLGESIYLRSMSSG